MSSVDEIINQNAPITRLKMHDIAKYAKPTIAYAIITANKYPFGVRQSIGYLWYVNSKTKERFSIDLIRAIIWNFSEELYHIGYGNANESPPESVKK